MPIDISDFPYLKVPSVHYPNNVYVYSQLTDFPTPSGNVISIPSGATIILVGTVDLLGYRLVALGPISILGNSQTNTILKSTGLPNGEYLITSNYNTSISKIQLQSPSGTFLLSMNTTPGLDCFKVTFDGDGGIGTLTSVQTILLEACAFTGQSGLNVAGTINSFVCNNSLFSNNSLTGTYVSFDGALTVNIRIRFVYCVFIVPAAATGLNFSTATIPNTNAIINNCNFSGAGTYLANITAYELRSEFRNNVGITNSDSEVSIRISDNVTATTVSASNTFYTIAGTNTVPVAYRFTSLGGVSARYDGARTKSYLIIVSASLGSGNNQKIGLTFTKNGAAFTTYQTHITTSGSGDQAHLTCHGIVPLATNDVIKAWVQNNTSASDITVEDLVMTITELP